MTIRIPNQMRTETSKAMSLAMSKAMRKAKASPLFKLPQGFCYRNKILPNTLFSLVKGLWLYLYPVWLMYIWFWGQKTHLSRGWKKESFGSDECRGLYRFSILYRLTPSLWKWPLPGRNRAHAWSLRKTREVALTHKLLQASWLPPCLSSSATNS